MTVTVSIIDRSRGLGVAGGEVAIHDLGEPVEITQIGVHCLRPEADDLGPGVHCGDLGHECVASPSQAREMPVRLFLRDSVFDDGRPRPIDLSADSLKLFLELVAPIGGAGISPAALFVVGSDENRNRLS